MAVHHPITIAPDAVLHPVSLLVEVGAAGERYKLIAINGPGGIPWGVECVLGSFGLLNGEMPFLAQLLHRLERHVLVEWPGDMRLISLAGPMTDVHRPESP